MLETRSMRRAALAAVSWSNDVMLRRGVRVREGGGRMMDNDARGFGMCEGSADGALENADEYPSVVEYGSGLVTSGTRRALDLRTGGRGRGRGGRRACC